METIITCPTCDHVLDADAGNCLNCGQPICLYCHEPLLDGSEACDYCGADSSLTCPDCGRRVKEETFVCPRCGLLLKEFSTATIVPEYTRFRIGVDQTQEKDESTGICPACEALINIEDGICQECGQSICSQCGHPVQEDDEECPGCRTKLYFDCYLCGFILVAGTEICPNCNALFPVFCSRCGFSLQVGKLECPSCRHMSSVVPRPSARVIRSFIIGQHLVRMIACPECGKLFDPSSSLCPICNSSVCGECLLVVKSDERFCPRCGYQPKSV